MKGHVNVNRLEPHRAGLSLAISLMALSLVCLIAVVVLPTWAMVFISNSLMHGIDVSEIWAVNISLQSFATGIVVVASLGYGMGSLFAAVYNRL